MSREQQNPVDVRSQTTTTLSLAEFRRRLAKASMTRTSFGEKDAYGKRTDRLVLPPAYSNAFDLNSKSGRVTLGFEGQLLLLPQEVWDEYLAETQAIFASSGCERLIDELIRHSHPIHLDSKRRITLSEHLVSKARLDEGVLLYPSRVIELWNEQIHDAYRQEVLVALHDKAGITVPSHNNSPKE